MIAKLTGSVRSKLPAATTTLLVWTSNEISTGFPKDTGQQTSGKTTGVVFKVLAMITKRLYLVILLLVMGCQQPGVGADKPALSANETIAEAELGKQLRINRDALLKGSSEQIRIDAATVMLFSEDLPARKILLDVLRQSENSAARMAVCKALGQTRATQEPIRNKDDFIQPLLNILATEDFVGAKLAAEATLIFKYKQISEPLEKRVSDPSLPVRTRLNAIYALKLQPDMGAISKLMDLVDDPEGRVAAEAEKAIKSLGIPVGKDAKTRREIIKELERKGRDEFLRDWLIRQEAKIRKLETELGFWQKHYLAALDKIYAAIGEDVAKAKFLAGHLGGSEAIVRLWALEKVSQWRVGTTSKLPAELGPILVNLVSNQDRDVRLKTAKLLSLMGQLNSAQQLLEQLEIEQDDEVRMELFIALGGACYYAFLPNSEIRIPEEIRKRTFEWAAEYLAEQDSKKAQKGAGVIRRLLEQDGLTSGEVDRYLSLLAERYKQEKDKADGALRGELLSAMAGLCAQSVYKGESARRFGPLFEEALEDGTDLVREAAVDGLIYIDKTRALKTFRKVLVNDSSIKVREKVINLAGEVGSKEDLVWLAEKAGSTAASESSWQAMLKIFKRSDADVLSEWLSKFDSANSEAGLSDEQRISFLEVAERKAVGEKKLQMLKGIREELALAYSKSGEFEQAAKYLGMLRETAQTAEEREEILADLMDVYLRWPNVEAAVHLVNNCLLEKDLDPNSVVVLSIDNYLAKPLAGTEPNVILEALATIKILERPEWERQKKRWIERLREAEEPDKPKGTGN